MDTRARVVWLIPMVIGGIGCAASATRPIALIDSSTHVVSPAERAPIATLAKDGMVVRWPARTEQPIAIHVERGANGEDQAAVEEAFRRWETVGVPLRFAFVDSPKRAEIIVRWIDRFPARYNGWTTVHWNERGWITSAVVELARRTPKGTPLSDVERRAVATHEVGHALGLAHTPDSTALMWPALGAFDLTTRDISMIVQLYQTPPGALKGTASRAQRDGDQRSQGGKGR